MGIVGLINQGVPFIVEKLEKKVDKYFIPCKIFAKKLKFTYKKSHARITV